MIDRLYVPIKINNFLDIQESLKRKYSTILEKKEKITQVIEWSQENFLDLYLELNNRFEKQNSKIILSRLFFTPACDELGAHADGQNIDNNYWALNIPISVPKENHFQEWFSYDDELVSTSNTTYVNFILPKFEEKLKSIGKLTLLEPHFVKVGVFHRVVNLSKEPRLILTIRFVTRDIDNLLKNL